MSRLLKVAGILGAVTLALTPCAPTAATTRTPGADGGGARSGVAVPQFDITQLCGDEEIQVALTDGAAGHTWRKITLAEMESWQFDLNLDVNN